VTKVKFVYFPQMIHQRSGMIFCFGKERKQKFLMQD